MRIATRLVGAWILLGAYLKLFHGTPADLPAVVRDLPLAIGLTFKLVIGIELAIGLGALLRPSEGWAPATILMIVFCAVLVQQVQSGAASCGCMGTLFEISPTIMLCIDGALLAFMLLSAPWREQLNQAQIPRKILLFLMLLLAVVPWFLDRQASGSGAPTGNKWASFDKPGDIGKRLLETAIGRALPKAAQINDGLLVFYSDTCPECRDHLNKLSVLDDLDLHIVLLKLPIEDDGEEAVVDQKPIADDIVLPGKPRNWAVTPPAEIRLEGGVIKDMREAIREER